MNSIVPTPIARLPWRMLFPLVALTLFGQAIVVRTMRAGFERLIEAPVSNPDVIEQIKSEIVANAKAILTSRREQAA